MSKGKYLWGMLLCFALALMIGPVYAADVAFQSWTFSDATEPAGWSKQAPWEYGVPQGAAGDPDAGYTGTRVYGTNLAGAYGPNVDPAKYLISAAVNCTGKWGIKLTFWRWLTVEDSAFDQATVAVSGDNGATWTQLWMNPSNDDDTADLLDTAWTLQLFDISAVADNKSAVKIRWGLRSNGSDQFGGWNIDDVTLWCAGPEVLYSYDMSSDPGFDYGTGWEYGEAIEGTSGDDEGAGKDPEEDADGQDDGNIIGYRIGDNYENPMTAASWLTVGPLDFTGQDNVQLRFMRYLSVVDARWDHVSIQATNSLDPTEVFADDFEAGLGAWTIGGTPTSPAPGVVDMDPDPDVVNNAAHLIGQQTITKAIDTSNLYDLELSYAIGADNLEGGDSFVLEYSLDGGDHWTAIETVSTDQDLTPGTFSLPAEASDNPDFQIRFRMNGTQTGSDVDDGYADDVLLEGVEWTYIWQNPAGEGESILDEEWTRVTYDLSAIADNQETVWVRWGMGPTYNFPTDWGGWSIDNVEFIAGSQAWRSQGATVPTALVWGQSGAAQVRAQNVGTATWDSTFEAWNVQGDDGTDPIRRWGVESVPVAGTVAPGAIYTFSTTLKAPPLTSIVYDEDVRPTWTANPDLSKLSADWNLKSPAGWVPTYEVDGESEDIARAGVITSRFPDVQPGTSGYWARFWVEELAGLATPYVIAGYPDGTYRPLNTVDRAAIAVYIARAASLDLGPYGNGDVFRDVPADFWACAEIEACADEGIVSGYPDDTYRPTLLINRGGMAKLIALGSGMTVPDPGDITEPPFSDVPVDDPETPDVNEAHPFLEYIQACKDYEVVLGYPDGTYQPDLTITRDQLAVYIWRAFVRDNAKAVVLGGPAITSEDVSAADWAGFQEVGFAEDEDQNWAWVTFDAVRLGTDLAYGGTWDIEFALDGTGTPTSYAISLMPAQITAARDAAIASGEPYYTLWWEIPTGLHGDFNLVVSVEDENGDMWEVRRQPAYVVVQEFFDEDFETGSLDPNWTRMGQPDEPITFHTGALKEGNYSAEFKLTQKIARNISTVGRHDIRVAFKMAGANLGATEYMRVEWSKDDGVTWQTVAQINNVSGVPSKLTEYEVALPNGDPGATPPVIGADDNINFWLRVGLEATGANARGYIDDIVIKGS